VAWADVIVEMRSGKAGELISGEFRARSIFEAAWLARNAWCRRWYWDSECRFLTVRHGEQQWHVSLERVRTWRPPADVMADVERRGLS
jgi:hypothetical protein